MNIEDKAAAQASEAVGELVYTLVDDFHLPLASTLAGIHGEIVRHMVIAFGFQSTADLLNRSADTVRHLEKAPIVDELAAMPVAGRA